MNGINNDCKIMSTLLRVLNLHENYMFSRLEEWIDISERKLCLNFKIKNGFPCIKKCYCLSTSYMNDHYSKRIRFEVKL